MHFIPSLIVLASATAVLGTVIDRPDRSVKRQCGNKAAGDGTVAASMSMVHVTGTHHAHHYSNSVVGVPSGMVSASAPVISALAPTATDNVVVPSSSAGALAGAASSSVDTGDVVVAPSSVAPSSVAAVATSAAAVPATSAEVVVAPTSSAAAAMPSTVATTTTTPGTGTKKAGLGINSSSGNQLQEFVDVAGSQISWAYNWYSLPDSNEPTGIEYVPMFHDQGALSGFTTNSAKWAGLGVKNLLSLNEPDLNGITTAQGATLHQQAFSAAMTGTYKIGSPAVARGNKQWMSDWVTACDGKCVYDFVTVHFYGTNAEDLITYVKDFITTFGKPVWVTEYGCQDYSSNQICTADEAAAFQKTVVDYFVGDANVARYAAFGAFPDMASTGNGNALVDAAGKLNALGQVYATAG